MGGSLNISLDQIIRENNDGTGKVLDENGTAEGGVTPLVLTSSEGSDDDLARSHPVSPSTTPQAEAFANRGRQITSVVMNLPRIEDD
ncbi:hypothetical protein O1611_g439 [Lasiodiplodia mahajangana]|uniref:Uncharacterized protein n=1 Tax=Lasiodiplodia mahajangana TaxID=1108764 RepID=A0ACC2K0K1_9PEZI|nr:hypothetical protein O1611_g439 [Lasiodiplodia mahajangana]